MNKLEENNVEYTKNLKYHRRNKIKTDFFIIIKYKLLIIATISIIICNIDFR